MKAAFERAWTLVKDTDLKPAGAPMAIYHKFDPVAGFVDYTCCAPVETSDKPPGELPAEIIHGFIPKITIYTLRHVGAYRHLPNAWATANNLIQGKVFKPDPKQPPFESYLNMPGEVDEKDLITDIVYAVK